MTVRRRKPKLPVGRRIIEELEAKIVEGRLLPGDQLPTEEELVTHYGASRAAVREAVQVLKARGLVVSRRGSGSYVGADAGARTLRESLDRYASLRTDAQAFLELLDLRLLVETFCARQVAAAESDAGRQRVKICLERMVAAAGDLKTFGEEDIAFHQAVVEGAEHALFTTIFRGLLPGLGRRFAQATYIETSLMERTLADHRRILAALEARDPDAAEDCVRAHLNWAREHFGALLKEEG